MLNDTLLRSNVDPAPPGVTHLQDPIKNWRLRAESLEVTWSDGHISQYAFSLLRDWCDCNACADRRLVSSEAMLRLPVTCTPDSVNRDDDGSLHVIWKPDGHSSVYSTSWLETLDSRKENNERGQSGAALEDSFRAIDYDEVRDEETRWLEVLETVSKAGFAMISGVPDDPDELAHIGRSVGYVPNGWRYIAQPQGILVSAEGNPTAVNDLTIEDISEDEQHYQRTMLVPHTDFSFTSWPTGLFIFHCLSPSADNGGETILVDGFHVAERLRSEYPAEFELLSTVRQPFVGHGKTKIDWRASGRVISVNLDGDITGVRFALASRMPLNAPYALTTQYYQATQTMLQLVLDPDCQIRLALRAGECLILDNHRILHGRTGMDPVAGLTRRFRRFDVERDAAQTQLLRLAQQTGRDATPLPSGAHC